MQDTVKPREMPAEMKARAESALMAQGRPKKPRPKYTGTLHLLPIHYTPSANVTDYTELVRQVTEDFIAWVWAENGNLQRDPREGWAFSHCQVSETPLNLFVVDDWLVEKKFFPGAAIFNSRITQTCFPPASQLNGKPTGDEQLSVHEGCMSFPFKSLKKVMRWPILEVEYDYVKDGKLEHAKEIVAGLKGQLFQHAIDHSMGENIYYNVNRSKKMYF
jgi:peptide deformylase